LNTSIVAATEANIKRAAELVKSGCLVVYPTETVYGFALTLTHNETVFYRVVIDE